MSLNGACRRGLETTVIAGDQIHFETCTAAMTGPVPVVGPRLLRIMTHLDAGRPTDEAPLQAMSRLT